MMLLHGGKGEARMECEKHSTTRKLSNRQRFELLFTPILGHFLWDVL